MLGLLIFTCPVVIHLPKKVLVIIGPESFLTDSEKLPLDPVMLHFIHGIWELILYGICIMPLIVT